MCAHVSDTRPRSTCDDSPIHMGVPRHLSADKRRRTSSVMVTLSTWVLDRDLDISAWRFFSGRNDFWRFLAHIWGAWILLGILILPGIFFILLWISGHLVSGRNDFWRLLEHIWVLGSFLGSSSFFFGFLPAGTTTSQAPETGQWISSCPKTHCEHLALHWRHKNSTLLWEDKNTSLLLELDHLVIPFLSSLAEEYFSSPFFSSLLTSGASSGASTGSRGTSCDSSSFFFGGGTFSSPFFSSSGPLELLREHRQGLEEHLVTPLLLDQERLPHPDLLIFFLLL